jgi:hypothetical protein
MLTDTTTRFERSAQRDYAPVFRVIHFASVKRAKSFSFFFQKEALVSCSFLEICKWC